MSPQPIHFFYAVCLLFYCVHKFILTRQNFLKRFCVGCGKAI